MSKLVFIEVDTEQVTQKITSPIINGTAISLLKERLVKAIGDISTNSIIKNATESLKYYINPNSGFGQTKILCLGKVQSGKTAFFISALALAFDNGYKLAYVFAGTKNNLLSQNLNRLKREFSNNRDIHVLEFSATSILEVESLLNKGKKVVLVVLKNISSEYANLGLLRDYSDHFSNQPTFIVDDESDEYTPGAPKSKSKKPTAGKTHTVISEIFNNISVVTSLFVTATPQANLLLSTLDELSPNNLVLVHPGAGYVGGNAFHDSEENERVKVIRDHTDFRLTIPESFKEALNYFLLSASLLNLENSEKPYSMLVHPSIYIYDHVNVYDKILTLFDEVKNHLHNKWSLTHEEIKDNMRILYAKEIKRNINFEMVFDNLTRLLNSFKVYQFNTSEQGIMDIEEETLDTHILYKIYVGGNILGRGLTLPNLLVSYIYRDSKITPVDTLYQRARWFGYKSEYFDLCKVYLPEELKLKFIDATTHEDDLWTSLSSFLLTNISLDKFDRVFTLNNQSLILTRKTVSKTIKLERIKSGYNYDKSVLFKEKHLPNENVNLIRDYISKTKNKGFERAFSKGDTQTHFIYESTFTDIYENFIKDFSFPRNSKLGQGVFEKVMQQVKNREIPDELSLVVMRYKTGQVRGLNPNGDAIKELPQGYDNTTGYSGDKYLTDYMNKMHIQIHLVYKDERKDENLCPLIAFNNPLTAKEIQLVTGDAYEHRHI